MSSFAEKLRNLSKSSASPIGFRPSVRETKGPTMLLVVELLGAEPKEARILTDVKADAGLILGEVPGAKVFKQMVEAAGDVPVGAAVKGAGEQELDGVVGAGCDFVVFDIGMRAGALRKEGVGKFLIIERSLDQGLVRAINSLEVDGALITGKEGNSFLAVEHLLVCRRFVELLEKPVITQLPSEITKADLTSLWEVGIDGVIAPADYSGETLTELRNMLSDLPKRSRGRRAKGGAVLPRYGTNVTEEEEGDGDGDGEEV
jgi:hypothetical protein